MTVDEIFILALQNHQNNNVEAAARFYKKIIKTNPSYVAAHNNLGIIEREKNGYKKALPFFEKAIKIDPHYAAAYNNIGNIYRELDDFKKALEYYQQVYKINSNYTNIRYNLGIVYKSLKNLKEAINFFESVDTTNSRAQLLECLYFLKDINEYQNTLKKIAVSDPYNMKVAAIANYVSEKENLINIYPFCKNPLNFIYKNNIKNKLKSTGKFSKNLIQYLKNIKNIWEPLTNTTKGGYQTIGNLFNNSNDQILTLEKIIKGEILNFREKYKSENNYLIKKWPTNSNLYGWHIKLVSKGFQRAHIHPAKWLSGVFYLKVPKNLKKNEGSIKFDICGDDYPANEKFPHVFHSPKDYDLVLFPSSLFHRTIPFASKGVRHSIAFDLVPK